MKHDMTGRQIFNMCLFPRAPAAQITSAAISVRHRVRSSALRTIPAAAVPPIISVRMVTPVGAGNGTGGCSYRSTATSANGTSDDSAPQCALTEGSVEGIIPTSESRIKNSESFRISFPVVVRMIGVPQNTISRDIRSTRGCRWGRLPRASCASGVRGSAWRSTPASQTIFPATRLAPSAAGHSGNSGSPLPRRS